jgi:outer membrane protein OmpA-like peptidoglycan-associated protein
MRAAMIALGILLVAARAAGAAEPDPDAPVPVGAKFHVVDLTSTVEDLRFRIEPVGGTLQELAVKESATEIRIEMPADVLFDFDKAEIRPDAAKVLTKAAEVLREHTKRKVVIEGHTDGKGTEQYNQRLSERRAQAVKTWLQQHAGLKGMALTTGGWGAQRPVAPNTRPDGSDDPEGRQKNRRVEIVIAKRGR